MRLKMKSTAKGSPDGVTVQVYKKGETYDIADDLAEVFIAEKWATKVKDKKPESDPASDPASDPEPAPAPPAETKSPAPDDNHGLPPFGDK